MRKQALLIDGKRVAVCSFQNLLKCSAYASAKVGF